MALVPRIPTMEIVPPTEEWAAAVLHGPLDQRLHTTPAPALMPSLLDPALPAGVPVPVPVPPTQAAVLPAGAAWPLAETSVTSTMLRLLAAITQPLHLAHTLLRRLVPQPLADGPRVHPHPEGLSARLLPVDLQSVITMLQLLRRLTRQLQRWAGWLLLLALVMVMMADRGTKTVPVRNFSNFSLLQAQKACSFPTP
jgi:hypothetical protein